MDIPILSLYSYLGGTDHHLFGGCTYNKAGGRNDMGCISIKVSHFS